MFQPRATLLTLQGHWHTTRQTNRLEGTITVDWPQVNGLVWTHCWRLKVELFIGFTAVDKVCVAELCVFGEQFGEVTYAKGDYPESPLLEALLGLDPSSAVSEELCEIC